MKKFMPRITIWTVVFTDKVDDTFIGQEYFLFRKQAEKWRNECLNNESYDDVDISLGGETLWLW